MPANTSLIASASGTALEAPLRDKLKRCGQLAGSLGELEPLALRLGLVQDTLKPHLEMPHLALFASDHGIAVDGVCGGADKPSTASVVHDLLAARMPVSAFTGAQGMSMSVVDCGIADSVQPHPNLLARKIAHGTRNLRVTSAMSTDQAHAAIRAGMEIADALTGNVIACAGIGLGAHESAALVLSALSGKPVRELVSPRGQMKPEQEALLMMVMQAAQARHGGLTEPVDVLAACGGFETAMMVGVMLVAASKRHLIMVDGMSACAALMVASRISPAVTGYATFCRSHGHPGLTCALKLFDAMAILELGLDCIDGTGAALSFPLVRSAAALLLSDIGEVQTVAEEALQPRPGTAEEPPGGLPPSAAIGTAAPPAPEGGKSGN
jgi:nicotinate-nucleotide--dimethylbenzimidazole phosphoribosyltransferase